jgi:hypothetical protein
MIGEMEEYLVQLLAEEALEIPETMDDMDSDDEHGDIHSSFNRMTRNEKIEKLINNMKLYNSISFLERKNVTMRYYCLNPNEYNECDTARGKERTVPFEDNEPFVEMIRIRKDGQRITTSKKMLYFKR